MSRRRNALWLRAGAAVALLVLLGVATSGCGPFVLLPGGELEGESALPPPDWAFTQDISTVQLETRPEKPYSVNIWATGVGDRIYVHAGRSRSRWVEHMEADDRVRLRVDGDLYSLRAVRVEDQAEFDRFAEAYEAKYGNRPRHEVVGEVHLFRLVPRDS